MISVSKIYQWNFKERTSFATDFERRTPENYAHQVDMIQNGGVEWSTYGIKADSCLNILPDFHVTMGIPPDATHDLGEGIIPYELLLGLEALIKKGFSLTSTFNIDYE